MSKEGGDQKEEEEEEEEQVDSEKADHLSQNDGITIPYFWIIKFGHPNVNISLTDIFLENHYILTQHAKIFLTYFNL